MFDRLMANRRLKGYASSIRERLKRQKSGGHVTAPLLDCDAIGKVPGLPLIAWLYFNPFGPTMCALCTVEVPGSHDHLLTFHMDNPFAQQRAVFGLIPPKDRVKALAMDLIVLFSQNGDPSCPLFGGLPTSVFHCDNWCLPTQAPFLRREQVHGLMFIAARALGVSNLRQTCESLRKFKGDPWARTSEELELATLEAVVGNREREQPQERGETPNQAEFDEWFELVTDLQHVSSERSNFQLVWQGALENANRRQ